MSNDRAEVHYGLNIVKYSFQQDSIDMHIKYGIPTM